MTSVTFPTVEVALSVALGLGLSAACGFRVFVPLLALSGAAQVGYVNLAQEFSWVGTTPAFIAFAVATALEVGAYYLPWIDNLLDTVATPAAVIAGIVVTASVVTGLDPGLKWLLAVIAGGGLAGVAQGTSVAARVVSSFASGGLTNPMLSTLELFGSAVLSGLAVLAPALALLVVVAVLVFAVRRFGMRVRRRPAT